MHIIEEFLITIVKITILPMHNNVRTTNKANRMIIQQVLASGFLIPSVSSEDSSYESISKTACAMLVIYERDNHK